MDDKKLYCVTPNKLFIWQRHAMQIAPKEIPFTDLKASSDRRLLINPSDDFCKILSPNTILLGNLDEVQVWTTTNNSTFKFDLFLHFFSNWQLAALNLVFQGHNTDSQRKFFFVDGHKTKIVAASHYELLVWNTQAPSIEISNFFFW